MCYAILRVAYKGEKGTSKDVIEVDRAGDLPAKLDEVKSKPMVSKVGVFLCSHSIERVETWETTAYAAKEESK